MTKKMRLSDSMARARQVEASLEKAGYDEIATHLKEALDDLTTTHFDKLTWRKMMSESKIKLPPFCIGETSAPGEPEVHFDYDISMKDRIVVTCSCDEAGKADIVFIRPPIRHVKDNDWNMPVVGIKLVSRPEGLASWNMDAIERFIPVVNCVYQQLHYLWRVHGPNQLPGIIEDSLYDIVNESNFCGPEEHE